MCIKNFFKKLFFIFIFLIISNTFKLNFFSHKLYSQSVNQKFDFLPIYSRDHRIVLNNISFERRPIADAYSESLDVVFSLENLIRDNIEIYVFISAFLELDLKELDNYNKDKPNLKWRSKKIEKQKYFILKAVTTPNEILPSNLWSANDSDNDYNESYKLFSKVTESNPKITTQDLLPPIWKYSAYMDKNPTLGLKLTLNGMGGNNNKSLDIQSGKAPIFIREFNGKSEYGQNFVRYNITQGTQKLILRSYHVFLRNSERKNFFNKILIQVYNAKEITNNQEQNIVPIIKQLYSIKFKGYY